MESHRFYNSLEEIRLNEKHKLLFKGRLTFTSIETTKQASLAQTYKVTGSELEKRFHPSWWRRLFLVLAVCFIFFYWVILVSKPIKNDVFYLVSSPLFLIGAFLIYDGFFNKRKNFNIHLDYSGIAIAGETYLWQAIQATAILQIGSGRDKSKYLVILFNDGTYKRFPLRSFATFWGFAGALSTYIEYFKNNKLT